MAGQTIACTYERQDYDKARGAEICSRSSRSSKFSGGWGARKFPESPLPQMAAQKYAANQSSRLSHQFLYGDRRTCTCGDPAPMASTQWSRKVHTKLTTLPLSVKVYNYAKCVLVNRSSWMTSRYFRDLPLRFLCVVHPSCCAFCAGIHDVANLGSG
ncbi:hypothetical protein KCU67_g17, partial [Aureobasidium melanogenum]